MRTYVVKGDIAEHDDKLKILTKISKRTQSIYAEELAAKAHLNGDEYDVQEFSDIVLNELGKSFRLSMKGY